MTSLTSPLVHAILAMDENETPTEPTGWEEYETFDDDDKDYLFELFSRVADAEQCLDMAWGCLMMQGFLFWANPKHRKGTASMLTEMEVKMIANQKHVDWEQFHTEIIVQIYKNRATNNHNASKRIISYDDWKFDYIKTMSKKYPDELRDADVAKKQKWSAIVYSFGIEFAKVLEGTISTGGEDLFSDIVQVLDIHSEWMPADEISQRKVYYIAGFMISAVKNNSKSNISAKAIEYFLSRATLSQDAAVEAGLPVEDVVERQVNQLYFANAKFYDLAIKLECVFYHILGEKSIEIFGPQIIAEMQSCLNKVDKGISSILDEWEFEDDVTNVRERVIEAFCNMRGKDYARKRRALAGFNFTETHRSTIGTLAKRAKDEAEKKKGEEINANTVFDNEINVDNMICAELRAELRKRKLFVSGKKAELVTRLKNDIANRKRAEQESG